MDIYLLIFFFYLRGNLSIRGNLGMTSSFLRNEREDDLHVVESGQSFLGRDFFLGFVFLILDWLIDWLIDSTLVSGVVKASIVDIYTYY